MIKKRERERKKKRKRKFQRTKKVKASSKAALGNGFFKKKMFKCFKCLSIQSDIVNKNENVKNVSKLD